jgi:hypothetical protein
LLLDASATRHIPGDGPAADVQLLELTQDDVRQKRNFSR